MTRLSLKTLELLTEKGIYSSCNIQNSRESECTIIPAVGEGCCNSNILL